MKNAAGEDVVAGTRTPHDLKQFKIDQPELYDQLYQVQEKLEQHYREMQDLEFTIEDKNFICYRHTQENEPPKYL